MKNCSPQFHVFLATSELWADFVKLAGDSSITRVGAITRRLSPCAGRGAIHNALSGRVLLGPVRTPASRASPACKSAATQMPRDLISPQPDAEVRDKALALVEDFARALRPTQFQAAYESLLVGWSSLLTAY